MEETKCGAYKLKRRFYAQIDPTNKPYWQANGIAAQLGWNCYQKPITAKFQDYQEEGDGAIHYFYSKNREVLEVILSPEPVKPEQGRGEKLTLF